MQAYIFRFILKFTSKVARKKKIDVWLKSHLTAEIFIKLFVFALNIQTQNAPLTCRKSLVINTETCTKFLFFSILSHEI